MKTITFEQLNKTIQNSPQIPVINVLPEKDFDNDHITGSENIPLQDNNNFTSQVEKTIGGKDKPVILYCASSECPASSNAAKTLESAGFTNVTVYEGGMKEWSEKSKAGKTKAA